MTEKQRNSDLQLTADVLRDENKQLRRMLSQAHAKIAKLECMADEDPLVAVLNRRAFERELNRTLSYIGRYGTRATMVFLDLDNFKVINDRHGHVIGDLVLKHVGDLLNAHVRQSDIVGRLGGDEYGLVLNQAGREDAEIKAQGLCSLIANTPFLAKQTAIKLTGSAGVSELDGALSAAEIIERADQAMYAVKTARKQA